MFFHIGRIFTNPKDVAGAEGIEPSSAVLETDVLPLNHAPVIPKIPDFRAIGPNTQPIFGDSVAHIYGKSSANIINIFKFQRK